MMGMHQTTAPALPRQGTGSNEEKNMVYLRTPVSLDRIYPTADTIEVGDTLIWATKVTPEPVFRTETVQRLTDTQVVMESGARLRRSILPRVRVRNEYEGETPQAIFGDAPDARGRAVSAAHAQKAVKALHSATGDYDDSYNACNVDGITTAYEAYIAHATAAFK